VESKKFDSFLVFDDSERLGENIGCLGCRGNGMDIRIAGIEDMSDIRVPCVNVFAPWVIGIVFEVFEGSLRVHEDVVRLGLA